MSKHWPFINPETIESLSVAWWSYYVRAAQGIVDASRDVSGDGSARDVRRISSV